MIQSKQIARFEGAFVNIASFASAGGTSEPITTALTSTLATAGNNGISVPVQPGSATTEGVCVAAGLNLCPVYSTATGKRLQDANGNDVYGKITFASSVWTIAYFSAPAGVEGSYTMAAAASLSIRVPYIFAFGDKPYYAGFAESERNIAPDGGLFNWREFCEPLTVTAANTLSPLTNTPDGRKLMLIVSDCVICLQDASARISFAGKQVSWSAANAGYPLSPGDPVTACYTY